MSTTVVVRKHGEVVIAADTLVKFGYTDVPAAFRRHDSKLVTVGSTTIAVVGWSAWCLVLQEYFAGLTEAPRFDSRVSSASQSSGSR